MGPQEKMDSMNRIGSGKNLLSTRSQLASTPQPKMPCSLTLRISSTESSTSSLVKICRSVESNCQAGYRLYSATNVRQEPTAQLCTSAD